ncbi:MAG: GHKL domain-containing protein [Taibaiella sp.]|nr:GHKL domain-containing protein [Taibaiella sp.]
MSNLPIPENEMERVLQLAELNIDFTNFDNFKQLARLAATIAGTEISFVNILDSYTQWTVSKHGFEIDQMPREDSVCQYTIVGSGSFEVNDLANDDRFKDKFYVSGDPNLRYYFGLPLQFDNVNLGALCVMDRRPHSLSPEKTEMLRIIAEEVVSRLRVYKYIEQLRNNITDVKSTQNKVLHDIRGPIGGIIGLAEIIQTQGNENKLDEVIDFINLIYKGGKSVLELADEILENDQKRNRNVKSNELTLVLFREKLEKLYVPQAKSKNIMLTFATSRPTEELVFPHNKLMQIAGNLISNAIKFTPKFGDVKVTLSLSEEEKQNTLKIAVKDSGEGIPADKVEELLTGKAKSTDGTSGEKGYGFGLDLVKHLVQGMNGTFNITSEPPNGALFEVTIPYPKG